MESIRLKATLWIWSKHIEEEKRIKKKEIKSHWLSQATWEGGLKSEKTRMETFSLLLAIGLFHALLYLADSLFRCRLLSFLLSFELVVTGQVLAPPTLPRHPSFPWNTDLSGPGAGNRDYNYPDSSCLGQMDNWLFPDSLLGWLNTITVHKVFWIILVLIQTQGHRTHLKCPL